MGLAHPFAEMGGAVEASCGPHPHKINLLGQRGGGVAPSKMACDGSPEIFELGALRRQ